MAENESQVIGLLEDFYHDSANKVRLIITCIVAGIIFLAGVSFYIHSHKPTPKIFSVGDEWRIVTPVPVDQPYPATQELLQWTSDVMSKVFNLDFIRYNDQLKKSMPYFTDAGWQNFLNQLNIYANDNRVQSQKLFVSGVPSGAPIILNQSLLSGRYAWLVQIPVDISYAYAGDVRTLAQTLTLQLIVVRVPTLNNLSGVAIDSVEVVKNTGSQQAGNGNTNGQ